MLINKVVGGGKYLSPLNIAQMEVKNNGNKKGRSNRN